MSTPVLGLRAEVGRALLDSMRHRGPDDEGSLQLVNGELRVDSPSDEAATVLLLHKRLSIIDLTAGGHQPMVSQDGRLALTYNGEVYNHVELRLELEGRGHRFRSNSDTEVLLRGWAEWGAGVLSRLVGMYAFAILDRAAGKLVLARDPFGIKPLYFMRWRRGLAFASELNTLLTFPDVDRSVDPSTLFQYLRWGSTVNGDRTLLRSVSRLEPGEMLEVSLDRPTLLERRRHFVLPPGTDPSPPTFEAAASRLRELFLDSVRLHLRSDVAVGAALSGGVDSSSLVMAMRTVEPKLDLHAFTYVAVGARTNEERWAREVARAARVHLHPVIVQPSDVLEHVDDIIRANDEPFGSTSIIAQYFVFREARKQGVTVMLDGQGADEVLAGYSPYRAARLASLLRAGRPAQALKFLWHAGRWPDSPHRVLVQHAADRMLPARLNEFARRSAGKEVVPRWMDERWFLDRDAVVPALRSDLARRSLPEQLRDDVFRKMLQNLLRYEDRNSMAHSVESRVPFLTGRLVEYVWSLPESYSIDDRGTTKALFREAMRGLTPDVILDRREKIGFETPEREWLLHLAPWVDRHLSAMTSEDFPALRVAALQGEWARMRTGGASISPSVWRWVNFVRWREITGATLA